MFIVGMIYLKNQSSSNPLPHWFFLFAWNLSFRFSEGIATVEATTEVLGWSESWGMAKSARDYDKNSFVPSSKVVHKGWIYYPDYNTEYYVGHTWWTTYHYTRARGEHLGSICGDSGRVFDTNHDGYSRAKSGVCVREYVGKTYYGVG